MQIDEKESVVQQTPSSVQHWTIDETIENVPTNDKGKNTFRTFLKTSSKFFQRNHPIDQILQKDRPRVTISVNCSQNEDISLLSMIEPKSFQEAAEDKHWVAVMEEELDQIQKTETWEFVPRPEDKNMIGTKWVYRNKLNEDGKMVRNKVRLVCKGYA